VTVTDALAPSSQVVSGAIVKESTQLLIDILSTVAPLSIFQSKSLSTSIVALLGTIQILTLNAVVSCSYSADDV
jgi:hypothetical protein